MVRMTCIEYFEDIRFYNKMLTPIDIYYLFSRKQRKRSEELIISFPSQGGLKDLHGSKVLIGYKGALTGVAYESFLTKTTLQHLIIPYPKQPVPCDGVVDSVLLRLTAPTLKLFLGVWQGNNNGR